ncbi:hypothetical protein SISSUDRAFT_1032648 [Sistotremastrum suecicum HHB10207 ss-3]|uniref:Uncharacterized protein n=1 Tax=Sistotremastrum suecicum HHB10207 ss-3 TaxID=1314776 RepID=A0A166EBZ5_9AGAM|nr:hypothetical protein SISSUDRAFT_1032648 [Sistotremastrum suecicum HHB10207 ss-3]
MVALRLSFSVVFLALALTASAAPTSISSQLQVRQHESPACGGPGEMSCDVAQTQVNLDLERPEPACGGPGEMSCDVAEAALDLAVEKPECGGPGEMSCDVAQAPLVLKERTPCGQAGGPSCDLCGQFPNTAGC